MEAFEQVVKVFLENRGYIVANNVKFPVRRKTKKAERDEFQTHGYEMDIVAAKSNRLLLGSVKSFFGSGGVDRQDFKGIEVKGKKTRFEAFKVFNEPEIRRGIIKEAQRRYGYEADQIQLCLFVGRFRTIEDEHMVIRHLKSIKVGAGSIDVYNLQTIMKEVIEAAKSKTYFNEPVLVTIKALRQSGYKITKSEFTEKR